MLECKLDEKSIDEIAQLLTDSLSNKKVNKKDVLRLRLSVEEVMSIWSKELGKNTKCTCETGRRFGKSYLILSVEGKECDPSSYNDTLGIMSTQNILTAMGMMVSYEYANNTNILKVFQPESSIQKFLPTLCCFCGPLLFGFTLKKIAPNIAATLLNNVVDPIFNKQMDVLSLIASPLIFLSIFSGVLGIGDKQTFDKIGKKSCIRFMTMTFVVIAITILACLPLFSISLEGNTNLFTSLASSILLLLDIIPKDIISPFLEGNASQIVFLGLVMGLACLSLGELTKNLNKIIEELSLLVQQIMNAIGKIMDIFMIFSLSDVALSDSSFDLSSLIKFVILIVLFCIAYIILYSLYLSFRYKLNPITYIKTLLPSMVTVFTTSSMPSVLGLNLDVCNKDLKIKNRFSNFCVPFGQIVYKPATGLSYLLTVLCLAEFASVPITPGFLITCLLLCSILAIATPPIPGGAIGSLTMLLSQLSIPTSTLALAINLTLLMDNTCALTNDVCFISETYILANKLDMVEKK